MSECSPIHNKISSEKKGKICITESSWIYLNIFMLLMNVMNTLLTDIPSKSLSESREDEKMNARHRKRGKDEISREKREALLKDLNLEYA